MAIGSKRKRKIGIGSEWFLLFSLSFFHKFVGWWGCYFIDVFLLVLGWCECGSTFFVTLYVFRNKVYNSLIIHFEWHWLNAVMLRTRFACIFLPKALNLSKCVVCCINSFDQRSCVTPYNLGFGFRLAFWNSWL